MKNLNFKNFAFVLFTSSILFTSCTELTEPVTPVSVGPTATLATGTDIVSQDASVNAGATFTVNLTSSKGDSPLKVLTIQEAGVNVPFERIKVNGVAASSNPILLFGNDQTALDYKIGIVSHTTIGAKAYAFILEDNAGKKATKTVSITTSSLPPTLTLKSADSLSIAPESLFSLSFKVIKGTSALKSIEVQENGVAISPLSRISYDKLTNVFTSNPQPIAAEDKDTFEKSIIINSPKTSGRYVYTFIFTDEAGLSKSQKVVAIVGTSVELIEGALLNSAGPVGTGGLDLDTGKGTGSTNAAAKIIDLGIDDAKPLDTNWKQQIAGANGSVVKYVVAGKGGVLSTFTFEGVNSKEEIADLFGKGTAFTQTNGGKSVSNQVAIGDVFVVQNGTKYYLLKIKNIVIVKTDNSDKYVIDIKK